jgi:hypothetical protein
VAAEKDRAGVPTDLSTDGLWDKLWHHGGMVLLGDYIFGGHGHNQGHPFCLEMKSGKFAWEPARGPGSGRSTIKPGAGSA